MIRLPVEDFRFRSGTVIMCDDFGHQIRSEITVLHRNDSFVLQGAYSQSLTIAKETILQRERLVNTTVANQRAPPEPSATVLAKQAHSGRLLFPQRLA